MDALARVRDWWLGQFRKTSRLGKVAWVGVPLLLGCCFVSFASSLLVSPDVEPAAELAERAGVSVDAVDVVATEEPAEATAAPTEVEATRTTAPTQTAAPTRTAVSADVVTSTEEPATAKPSATPRPATASAAPSATDVPATATRVPATVSPPTATSVPPTAAPTRVPPTSVPPTAVPPTAVPQPTATLPPAVSSGDVVIASVRYDGDVPQVESDEFAVITNRGGVAVNLGGWRLNAGEPDQNFTFPSFDLQPGQSCRVYTNEAHPESCGFSFGRGDAIWRNSGDCGALFDATGAEVSRYCW